MVDLIPIPMEIPVDPYGIPASPIPMHISCSKPLEVNTANKKLY